MKMRLFSSVLSALVLLAYTVPLASQQESLVVGPGDTLHISVFEAPDLDQRAKVTDNGEIRLILGGDINLKGTTPSQASRRIEDRLKTGNYFLDPHVSVAVEHYATQAVSVFGQVRLPGAYPMDTSRSLVEVLSLAGGLGDLANRHVSIQRRGTGEKVTFFISNVADAALTDTPLVYPGDIVFVPKADIVYFLGDVNRPGGIAQVSNDAKLTALQALSLAGGTPPTAVPGHARLVRKSADGTSSVSDLNLSAMQKGKQADILLQADDIIYVPYSYVRNLGVNISGLISAAAGASVYKF